MNAAPIQNPGLNWRGIRALIGKDLRVVLRSKPVLIPVLIVPLIMQILMPLGIGLSISFIPMDDAGSEIQSELDDLEMFFKAMPPSLREELSGLSTNEIFLTLMLVYLFAPMYLIVPLMVSSVFAADSFAGEKERKTLEALLHTPLTDAELMIGKFLAAWIPAVVVAVGAFVIYTVIVDALSYFTMNGRILLPNLMWLVLVFWVAPAASALGLAGGVLVSSKVKTFQEAYQLSGLVVLPVIILMLSQVFGLVFLSPLIAFGLGVFLWIVAGVLLALSVGLLQRGELIARL